MRMLAFLGAFICVSRFSIANHSSSNFMASLSFPKSRIIGLSTSNRSIISYVDPHLVGTSRIGLGAVSFSIRFGFLNSFTTFLARLNIFLLSSSLFNASSIASVRVCGPHRFMLNMFKSSDMWHRQSSLQSQSHKGSPVHHDHLPIRD